MNSKHLTGRAADLAAVIDGEVRWDWPLYHKLAEAAKRAAKECGVAIVWAVIGARSRTALTSSWHDIRNSA